MARVAAVLILLGATGTASAAPGIAIDPTPIGFGGGRGTQFGGGAPGEVQLGFFQVKNTGTTPLIVTDVAITGPGAGH